MAEREGGLNRPKLRCATRRSAFAFLTKTESVVLTRNLGGGFALSKAATLMAASLAAAIWMMSSYTSLAQSLTSQDIAKLEPELCKSGSSAFQSLTGLLPFLAGSPSSSMAMEQIALIDQYKASGRRKVWVLRLPAAFISQRPCDAGRTNWIGEGDDLRVSQIYQLSLVILQDRIVPLSRAGKQETEAGIRVTIEVRNRVGDPEFLHRAFERRSFVIGRIGPKGPPRCHDVPSDIPGLVTFRRIDPTLRDPLDCEGSHARGVFAEKLNEGTYDFVGYCEVNCRFERDYNGWQVYYSYHHRHLPEWQKIHSQMKGFLADHTVHLETE
jgi:hypothetical protein